ncbi:MAG: hypothetical protein L3J39_06660 [Verrucomicrobiales bacterium]|nr:hypothetical protein [Verrucomicrobiales bacterium]
MTITHQTVMDENGKPSAVIIPWKQFELIREELENLEATPEEEDAIAEAQKDRADRNDEAFMDLKDFMAEYKS